MACQNPKRRLNDVVHYDDPVFYNMRLENPPVLEGCNQRIINFIHVENAKLANCITGGDTYFFSTFFNNLCNLIYITFGYFLPNQNDKDLLFLLLRTSLIFLPSLEGTVFNVNFLGQALRLTPEEHESLRWGQEKCTQNERWYPIFTTKHPEDLHTLDIEWPQASHRVAKGMLRLLSFVSRSTKMGFFRYAATRFAISMPMIIAESEDTNLDDFIKSLSYAHKVLLAERYPQNDLLKFIFAEVSAKTARSFSRGMAKSAINLIQFKLKHPTDLLATLLAVQLEKATELDLQSTGATPMVKVLWAIGNNYADLRQCFELISTHRLLAIMPEIFHKWNQLKEGLDQEDSNSFTLDHLLKIKAVIVDVLMFTLSVKIPSKPDEDNRIMAAQLIEWVSAWIKHPYRQIDLALRWASVTVSGKDACTVLSILPRLVNSVKECKDEEQEAEIAGVKCISSLFNPTCHGVDCLTSPVRFLEVADMLLAQRMCELEEKFQPEIDNFGNGLLEELECYNYFLPLFFGVQSSQVGTVKITGSKLHPLNPAYLNAASPQEDPNPLVTMPTEQENVEVHHAPTASPSPAHWQPEVSPEGPPRKREATEEIFESESKKAKLDNPDEIICIDLDSDEVDLQPEEGSGSAHQDQEKTPVKAKVPVEEPKVPEKSVVSPVVSQPTIRAMTSVSPKKMFASGLPMEVDPEELLTEDDSASGEEAMDAESSNSSDLWDEKFKENFAQIEKEEFAPGPLEPIDDFSFDYVLTEDEDETYQSAEEAVMDQPMDTTPDSMVAHPDGTSALPAPPAGEADEPMVEVPPADKVELEDLWMDAIEQPQPSTSAQNPAGFLRKLIPSEEEPPLKKAAKETRKATDHKLTQKKKLAKTKETSTIAAPSTSQLNIGEQVPMERTGGVFSLPKDTPEAASPKSSTEAGSSTESPSPASSKETLKKWVDSVQNFDYSQHRFANYGKTPKNRPVASTSDSPAKKANDEPVPGSSTASLAPAPEENVLQALEHLSKRIEKSASTSSPPPKKNEQPLPGSSTDSLSPAPEEFVSQAPENSPKRTETSASTSGPPSEKANDKPLSGSSTETLNPVPEKDVSQAPKNLAKRTETSSSTSSLPAKKAKVIKTLEPSSSSKVLAQKPVAAKKCTPRVQVKVPPVRASSTKKSIKGEKSTVAATKKVSTSPTPTLAASQHLKAVDTASRPRTPSGSHGEGTRQKSSGEKAATPTEQEEKIVASSLQRSQAKPSAAKKAPIQPEKPAEAEFRPPSPAYVDINVGDANQSIQKKGPSPEQTDKVGASSSQQSEATSSTAKGPEESAEEDSGPPTPAKVCIDATEQSINDQPCKQRDKVKASSSKKATPPTAQKAQKQPVAGVVSRPPTPADVDTDAVTKEPSPMAAPSTSQIKIRVQVPMERICGVLPLPKDTPDANSSKSSSEAGSSTRSPSPEAKETPTKWKGSTNFDCNKAAKKRSVASTSGPPSKKTNNEHLPGSSTNSLAPEEDVSQAPKNFPKRTETSASTSGQPSTKVKVIESPEPSSSPGVLVQKLVAAKNTPPARTSSAKKSTKGGSSTAEPAKKVATSPLALQKRTTKKAGTPKEQIYKAVASSSQHGSQAKPSAAKEAPSRPEKPVEEESRPSSPSDVSINVGDAVAQSIQKIAPSFEQTADKAEASSSPQGSEAKESTSKKRPEKRLQSQPEEESRQVSFDALDQSMNKVVASSSKKASKAKTSSAKAAQSQHGAEEVSTPPMPADVDYEVESAPDLSKKTIAPSRKRKGKAEAGGSKQVPKILPAATRVMPMRAAKRKGEAGEVATSPTPNVDGENQPPRAKKKAAAAPSKKADKAVPGSSKQTPKPSAAKAPETKRYKGRPNAKSPTANASANSTRGKPQERGSGGKRSEESSPAVVKPSAAKAPEKKRGRGRQAAKTPTSKASTKSTGGKKSGSAEQRAEESTPVVKPLTGRNARWDPAAYAALKPARRYPQREAAIYADESIWDIMHDMHPRCSGIRESPRKVRLAKEKAEEDARKAAEEAAAEAQKAERKARKAARRARKAAAGKAKKAAKKAQTEAKKARAAH